MTPYDPAAETGLPTENVGSLPRPQRLQDAYRRFDESGEKGDLEQLQDSAAKETIERFEQTGSPCVSDGEQRWSSFATYPIADSLAGGGLAPMLEPGGQYFAYFEDGHGRQLPKLVRGPFAYNFYAGDTLKKSLPYASKPMKQAVIAPSMLMLLYPLEGEVEGYSREQFESDLCDETERDIRRAFEVGAVRVSIDFTEGRLATRNDPRNPWTGAGLLSRFIELNNEVLDRFGPEERRNIGLHTCPGGDMDSVHSADVPYNNLLPELFRINAGYFLIQLASEQDQEGVYRSIGTHLRADADGVRQVAHVGVINPLSPRVESPEEIAEALVTAAQHIPLDQLGSTDDCGFSPFSIDDKPQHGSPDFARDVAFEKITNRVEGTRRAAERLKVS